MGNLIKTFSYTDVDADLVTKSEKAARDLGISYSAYILKCIRVDQEEAKAQKKVEGTSKGPIQTSSSKEENGELEYKPTAPYINSKNKSEFTQYISHLDETEEVGLINRNAALIHDLAFTRLKKLKRLV